MNNKHFAPETFFDLSSFAHRDLFASCEHVWEVLSLIKEYISKCKLGKIEVEIPQGCFIENIALVSIGEGTKLEPGAFIRGPCLIGRGSEIRQGAYIRGDVIVGDNCVIGHTTEAKNTVFLDGAQAGHFAYVGDCIVGNKANLGAGTKCANLKLNHKNIDISFEGKRYSTGLRKFGAIIGDRVQLGCNSVTNPGTLLGKESFVYPCVNVGGYVLSGKRVKE